MQDMRNMHAMHDMKDLSMTDMPDQKNMNTSDKDMSSMNMPDMDTGNSDTPHMDMDNMSMDSPNMSHMSMDSSNMNQMDMSDMSDMSHMDMKHMKGMHHDMSSMTRATRSMMGMHAKMFRRLFWISLVLAVPTVGLDPMFASLMHYSVPTTLPLTLIPAVFGTVMYFWTGWPFITGGIDEIRQRKPGMMLLILLGITTAFVASWLSVFGVLNVPTFWWELALLIVIMLAGHWIEMSSVSHSSNALDAFSSMLPENAHLLKDGSSGSTTDIPLSSVKKGMVLLVRPGEAIPADGVVIDGRAGVNESMVSGESMPVTRQKGDHVIAGSIATDSALTIRVSATGNNTTLSAIERLVEKAQAEKTPTQLLADRAAALLFWYALIAAAITLAVWLPVSGQISFALERVITVLVIACPHALGLAIPLVVSMAMGDTAAHGILITDRSALETLKNVDTVAFDKTGTLTMGTPSVLSVDTVSKAASGSTALNSADILRLAGAAESRSEHPLAIAIRSAAQKSNSAALPMTTDFRTTPGVGVSAHVDGHTVQVGGSALLDSLNFTVPSTLSALHSGQSDAATRVFVVIDGTLAAMVRIADQVRPQSRQAIEELHKRGIHTVMISGDSKRVADAVAKELGIDEVIAEVRPSDKAEMIKRLQKQAQDRAAKTKSERSLVAMVGDGVNDAPALAQSDIGIAIGAGTDVAASSAKIVLGGSDPLSIVRAIDTSRLTVRKMHQNLWWAAGYNLISVPLAAGILAWPPVNFVMPMWVGALLMGLSTVIVVLNAGHLKTQLARLK
jgi:Cu2+-exporting ATPase